MPDFNDLVEAAKNDPDLVPGTPPTVAPVDESNVAIASSKPLASALLDTLADIRAQKTELTKQEEGIKELLLNEMGELEYLALEDGGKPVLSAKHESALRINSDAVKAELPPAEFPDFYQISTSRPLRILK